jgi:hypothetical protein
MIAASAPVKTASRPATRRPGLGFARLVRLELRHNAMFWLLPVTFAVFWFVSYRKMNALPPLWYVRANDFQQGVVASFIVPVVGAGAWMGSRERRRHVIDQTTITTRPRWVRLFATWAATAIWALVGWLICLAVVYGVTAHLATWGGPLWWPAVVAAASVVAFSALGFTAGALLPGRLTPPAVAIASFFVLALSTQLINGGQSYWQISPIVAGPWESSQDPGVATFYPFVPDLSIAQVMFLAGLTVAVLGAVAAPRSGRRARSVAAAVAAAGLLAAGTAVKLAGTGRLDAHGMITIAALHDAGSDRPLRFAPDCSRTPIPVCVNPAYARYLPAVAAALRPMLAEIAGLPGAPVRISQAAATYEQGPGNSVGIGLAGKELLDGEYRTLLPDQSNGGPMTISQLAGQVKVTAGPAIVASLVGDHPGASEAQQAVAAGLSIDAGVPAGTEYVGPPIPRGGHVRGSCTSRSAACARSIGRPAVSAALAAAARRFAALPLAARRAWLAQHLTALRAGQITLEQLP